MGGIVAIVGRPNVGKSTFFNRLIKKREAIVDAVSGVTRDRHYGQSDWNGIEFSLIDTGGYIQGSDDIFQKEIDKQVNLASKRLMPFYLWSMWQMVSLEWMKPLPSFSDALKSLFF